VLNQFNRLPGRKAPFLCLIDRELTFSSISKDGTPGVIHSPASWKCGLNTINDAYALHPLKISARFESLSMATMIVPISATPDCSNGDRLINVQQG
jgi:hypothetical protein